MSLIVWVVVPVFCFFFGAMSLTNLILDPEEEPEKYDGNEPTTN
jgi:hypothetical protein